MKKQIKHSTIFNLDTLIIFIIAACIIFLNAFINNKFMDLERVGNEAMFIMDGLEYPESNRFKEEIIKYRPDSCKMIEMYNSDYELLFSLQFSDVPSTMSTNINDYPELVKIFELDREGQTTINAEDYTEEIYFQWVTNDSNEERLIIVYSSIEEINDIWLFQLVCYVILILVFVLLIRFYLKGYQSVVNRYHLSSQYLTEEMHRK